MERYADGFEANGYDDEEVVGAMTEEELEEVGVRLKGHRKKILLRAVELGGK